MKNVKDTRERWFGAATVASSAVGEAASQTTVRISDVVVVGDVRYIAEHNKLGLPSCNRFLSSPGKSKTRRVPVSSVVAKKNKFLLKARLQVLLHFQLLSRRVSRSRWRKEVVAIVATPQFSRGDMNNTSIVYMYRLLAFIFSSSINSITLDVFCA